MHHPILAAAFLTGLAAAAHAGANIAYFADVEPANNDGGGTAAVMPCGNCTSAASAVCRLEPGDADNFLINLTVGDEISVMTAPLAGLPLGFSLPDTKLEVFNPFNTLVASNDDAGESLPSGGLGSVVRYRAAGAGMHRIRIVGYSPVTSGDYALTIARRTSGVGQFEEGANDTAVQATALSLTSGPLVVLCDASGADVDYFAVDMEAGGVLSVMTSPITSTSVPDTIISILGTDGITTLVTNDDAPIDGADSRGSAVRFRAPSAGRYYIRQTPFAGSSPGLFHLIAALTPASDCPGDANADRIVNFADITAVLANFNAACR